MSAAFTPGPWHFNLSVWRDGHRCVLDASDVAIAHTIDRGNDEANARLIAAAPEIYEAGEALVSAAHRNGPTSDKYWAACEALAAALAKARGEQ